MCQVWALNLGPLWHNPYTAIRRAPWLRPEMAFRAFEFQGLGGLGALGGGFERLKLRRVQGSWIGFNFMLGRSAEDPGVCVNCVERLGLCQRSERFEASGVHGCWSLTLRGRNSGGSKDSTWEVQGPAMTHRVWNNQRAEFRNNHSTWTWQLG